MMTEFINPITNSIDKLTFNRIEIGYNEWLNFISRIQSEDEITVIKSLMRDLNCSKVCYMGVDKKTKTPIYKPVVTTKSFNYQETINRIYTLALMIKDQFMYNHILDTIITMHEMNLMVEEDRRIAEENVRIVNNIKPKRTRKVVKAKVYDMFTGEADIVDVDNNTGKILKHKNTKEMDFSNITYSFKIK